MTPDQIVRTFVDYFRERGHRRIAGDSLLPPPGDPVLFTTSGMHPLTPYLEGRPHPLGRRLVNVQRCLRTTDLDEVGDRHPPDRLRDARFLVARRLRRLAEPAAGATSC